MKKYNTEIIKQTRKQSSRHSPKEKIDFLSKVEWVLVDTLPSTILLQGVFFPHQFASLKLPKHTHAHTHIYSFLTKEVNKKKSKLRSHPFPPVLRRRHDHHDHHHQQQQQYSHTPSPSSLAPASERVEEQILRVVIPRGACACVSSSHAVRPAVGRERIMYFALRLTREKCG